MGTLNIAFFYDWKLCAFIGLDIHIRLMTGSLVILINPYFFSSNGSFDDYGIGFSHENCVMSQKFNTNSQFVAANAVPFLKLKKKLENMYTDRCTQHRGVFITVEL